MKGKKDTRKSRNAMGREPYRELRTKLKMLYPDTRVLSFVHSIPEHDAFPLVYRLGASYVATGEQVLVVDGDLRRSTVDDHPYIGERIPLSKEEPHGVKDEEDGHGGIYSTSKGPDVLVSERAQGDSTEFLETKEFGLRMEELKEKYDRILLVAPSFTESMDGLLLSSHAEGAIYIVQKFKTQTRLLNDDRKLLEKVNVKLLGAILKES